MTLVQATELGPIMKWVADQRAARKVDESGKKVEGLSDGSIRHNLNLLSRFFAWAIEHGHTQVNPVRMIPHGKRPQQAQKRDIPWIDDDEVVVKLMKAPPEPVNLMFYLGTARGCARARSAGCGCRTWGI
jgi:site-specific recombinase XerC